MRALGAPPPNLPPSEVPSGYYPHQAVPPSSPRLSGTRLRQSLLRGLGLVGVAVISGTLWWLFRHQAASEGTASQTGRYQFSAYHGVTLDSDCTAHSTGQVRDLLMHNPCQQLSRALYTTNLADGSTVIVSVVQVRMGDAAAATGLEDLVRRDGTGNVNTLVEDGVKIPGGPTSLADGAFAASRADRTVTIALTEFVDRAKDSPDVYQNQTLRGVSQDALRLGGSGTGG